MNERVLIFISVLIFWTGYLFPYDPGAKLFDENAPKGSPVFRYSIFRSFTEETDRNLINIHADITNDRLQFIKTDSLYTAAYVISAALFTGDITDAIPLFQKSENVNIRHTDYVKTQSDDPENEHEFKFTVAPGLYTAVIILKDTNSGKKHTVRKSVNIDPGSDIMISDMRMVSWTDDDKFLESYTPLINNVVDKSGEFTGALFEIFSESGNQLPFRLSYSIISSNSDTVYEDSFTGSSRQRMQYQVLKIPLEKLNAGNYLINMEIEIGGMAFEKSTVFYLRWKDISLNVSDISTAVEQMLYLVEYDSIKNVFDYSEENKKKWFKEYWEKLEDSLGLKKNSLMEEYFRRVAYSNVHFSIPKKQGWKTDMGKVLCMMGEPDEVQSYPFAKNKRPYEVWIYYDTDTQYIFDYDGGEYRIRK